jgi:hypothetical protein
MVQKSVKRGDDHKKLSHFSNGGPTQPTEKGIILNGGIG